VRPLLLLLLAPLAAVLPALRPSAASALDAWTGTVEGSMVEHGHRDNQDPDPEHRLIVDDDQVYRIRFSFGFRVTENGDIVGSGQGEYLEASWHIEGTNGGAQVLCDPVFTVPETFDVEVVGQANGRTLEVEFRLIDVMESNPETDCGGNFTAYAVESFEIVGSMNTADARMVTLDQANPSLAPITLHESIQDGDRLREVDHEWTFDIRHDCGGSDYGDPSGSGYINQYDAGDALDLPTSHGQKGGNSCGPTSFAMLVNAFKRGSGGEFPDLQELYDATVSGGNFTWASGLGTAYSMGYFEAVQGFGIDQINAWLASGVPVLASTTFSTTAWGNRGGGHVILITGRTAAGDYVVSDPAGDYYSSSTNHYGDDKCGDNVVYPKAGVEANAQGRAMLAIPNYPGADPLVLVAVGEAPGGGRGDFRFWLEDGLGRKVGWTNDLAPVAERPTSWGGVDPILPSDPSAPEVVLDPDTWPYAAVTLFDVDDLLLRVQSTGAPAPFEVRLRAIENGRLVSSRLEAGTLGAGETRTIPIPEPAAPLAALAALGALAARGRLGRPPQAGGRRS
jgi:hypothetical protein